jgi:hypothetical protein
MKSDVYNAVRNRFLIMGFVAILAGGYWNLSWPMALPMITLFFPVLIAVVIHCLFTRKSVGQRISIYAVMVIITELVRNLLYACCGQGLDYLLHDGETQLIAIALIVEQLLLGTIVIGILTLLSRRR